MRYSLWFLYHWWGWSQYPLVSSAGTQWKSGSSGWWAQSRVGRHRRTLHTWLGFSAAGPQTPAKSRQGDHPCWCCCEGTHRHNLTNRGAILCLEIYHIYLPVQIIEFTTNESKWMGNARVPQVWYDRMPVEFGHRRSSVHTAHLKGIGRKTFLSFFISNTTALSTLNGDNVCIHIQPKVWVNK